MPLPSDEGLEAGLSSPDESGSSSGSSHGCHRDGSQWGKVPSARDFLGGLCIGSPAVESWSK